MIDNHKIICATFAGRQHRMSLQVEYMNKLISHNLVDEWHIWDFAKNETDKKWIYSLEQYPKIQIMNKSPNVFHHTWRPFYSFYSSTFNAQEKIVLIKQDDDIVYIDLHKFKNFVQYRINNPKFFLLSANIINNGVCAGIQQEMIPLPYVLNPPLGFKYETHKGELWESSIIAHNLHNFFLRNFELFSLKGAIQQKIGDRISINYVSLLAQDFKHIEDCAADDEHQLSVEKSVELGRHNAIFLPFVVSHLSFCSQDTASVKENIDFNLIYNRYKILYEQLYQKVNILYS